MNKIYLIVTIAILFVACKQDNFKIEGNISNSQSSWIYLEKLGIKGAVPFDSSKIDSKGHFELSGDVSFPNFFLLKLNDQRFITLLIDSLEQISFSADYLNFANDYHIEGSQGSAKVKLLNQKLADTNAKIDSVKSLITLCQSEENYSQKKDQWITEIGDIYTNQKAFSKKFIEENPFSLASVLAIYQKFNDGNYVLQDLQTIKMAASALNSMYPKSEHASTLYRDTEKLVKGVNNFKTKNFIEEQGVDFPEINLPDYYGKNQSLTALKGKTILLQFWSAEDKTSRIQNEILVENYKKYKSKGFTIYQVSVDAEKAKWVEAIEADGLTWTNVNDLSGSLHAIHSYNITNIPSNYLIDKNGNIVAKNLKGPSLNRALSEILN